MKDTLLTYPHKMYPYSKDTNTHYIYYTDTDANFVHNTDGYYIAHTIYHMHTAYPLTSGRHAVCAHLKLTGANIFHIPYVVTDTAYD